MIYLDYAAATPVRKEVQKVMLDPEKYFANPSSAHDGGKKAKEILEYSREKIKKIINAKESDKIIFTSSGTESINLAIKGVAFALKNKGKHIITSKVEHKAVLETCRFLESQGFSVTYLDVDKYGRINPKDVEKAITSKTILISIMYANNEVGTIQPIQEIAEIAKKHKIPFHTDACQALARKGATGLVGIHDRAGIRQRVARQVMIGDQHIDAAPACLGHPGRARHAVVDGDDQPRCTALVG